MWLAILTNVEANLPATRIDIELRSERMTDWKDEETGGIVRVGHGEKQTETTTMMDCECRNWARMESGMLTEHHQKCAYYAGEVTAMVEELVKGIEAWAHDEDGVHPSCVDAYEKAKSTLVGRSVSLSGNGEISCAVRRLLDCWVRLNFNVGGTNDKNREESDSGHKDL